MNMTNAENDLLEAERSAALDIVSTLMLVLQARRVPFSIEDYKALRARVQSIADGLQVDRSRASSMSDELSNKVGVVQAAVVHVLAGAVPNTYGELAQPIYDNALANTRSAIYQES